MNLGILDDEKINGGMSDTEDCEAKSRAVDIHPLNVDSCVAREHGSPVNIVAQHGDFVTFSISQVWKGCDADTSGSKLSWIAADYVGLDDELKCSKFTSLGCGLGTVLKAKCGDGATVVDLYTYDESGLFAQSDGGEVDVPDACGATGEPRAMCHMRYVLKCEPSLCSKKGTSLRRLGGR